MSVPPESIEAGKCYLSNGRRVRRVAPDALEAICSQINNTPRKCLGFWTPHKVLTSHLQRAKSTALIKRYPLPFG